MYNSSSVERFDRNGRKTKMKNTAMTMLMMSALMTSAVVGCSTKSDDGAKESKLLTEADVNQKPADKRFKYSNGSCSIEFIVDLNTTAISDKLRSLNDQILSQTDLDQGSIQALATEAKAACDVILGTYGSVIEAAPADESAEDAQKRETKATCEDAVDENRNNYVSYNLIDLQKECAKASTLAN